MLLGMLCRYVVAKSPATVPLARIGVTFGFCACSAAIAVLTRGTICSASSDGTGSSNSTKREDNDRGQNAEDDDNDQEFNQGETTVDLLSSLLRLKLLQG